MNYDKSNMLGILGDFPEQCREAVRLARGFKIKGQFSSICVCGLGGSGIGGDLLKPIASIIPVYPVHDYNLPDYADKKTLVFVVSFSGNTEETLSCYKQAKKKKLKVVSITSGGRLAELDKNAIIIPKKFDNFQPRSAIGYLFLTMVAVLSNNRIISSQRSALTEVANLLSPKHCSRQGFLIAQKLKAKLPVFYASENLAAAAYRIKTAVNENAKQPAFWHYFPELNHNEMNGFKKNSSKLAVVLLADKKDPLMITKRMKLTKKIIKYEGVEVIDLDVQGKSLLARMMYAVYVGDYISYYMALMNKVDPTPVPVVENFKKRLNK